MKTFLFSLILLFSNNAFSENLTSFRSRPTDINCPNVDLTKTLPLLERKTINQFDTKWCCSYALIDALSIKYGKVFSPIDLAITQMKATKRSGNCNILQMPDIINQSEGLCLEKDSGHNQLQS